MADSAVPFPQSAGTGGGGDVSVLVQSQHIRLYLLCQRQTEDSRWVQAAAPTGGCNYHDKSRSEHPLTEDSERVGRSLMWSESSAAPTVNTNPSDARIWICVCGSVFVCLHLCVCGRPLMLMASFHCGHPVSSDHVTVFSSRLSAPPADTCATQTKCGQRH